MRSQLVYIRLVEEGIGELDEFGEPGEELDDDELVTHGFGDELGDFDDNQLEEPDEY